MAAGTGAGAASQAVGTFPAEFTPREREEVERLAHLFWQERGGEHGSPDEDWYRAEEEVLRRRTAAAETDGSR